MSAPSVQESVVITGIGLVTPLGVTRESTWSALLSGEKAGAALNPSQLGPAWMGIEPSPLWRGCPVPRTWQFEGEPLIGDVLVAAREALAHANLGMDDPQRWGCVIGASKGGLHQAVPVFAQQSVRQRRVLAHVLAGHGESVAPEMCEGVLLSPLDAWSGLPAEAWMQIWPDAPATAIAREFNICGPVLAPAAACATGLVSLIRAAELVQSGVCDVVLCGSSDASLQPALLASYRRLGVTARGHDPRTACKPFDRDRDGFLVGEGAAVLVVESRSHAQRRGATPLAEFVAGRTFSDGAGVAGLDESAEGLSRAIEGVCQAGGIRAREVDLINFHGTGTEQNDRTEFTALARVLAGQTPRGICCAFKGALGHLMGAAGSVEIALAVLSLRDQHAPPTANLRAVAPDLESIQSLPFTGESSTRRQIDTALKLSLGFGGPVAAVLLRRP